MPDCALTPNDPGCVAFYGTVVTNQSSTYAINRNALKQALAQFSQGTVAAGATGVTSNINTTYTVGPGVVANATATPWYKSWWGIGLLAVAGVGAIYHFKKSKPKAA